ncbi:two-component system, chemotaxis family, CheB/CheR fusion protein [Pustulibacterium marinum]|uniref:Two-component system, chemotaxis family, CheB/CheR fusion protein n=1 Tax=Pustulibacterium marinum TaxID=1224947 RepID=A0A1I7HV47_9FLAO|nr:chemotaxis protein CheB [Pustulibacterium marinum]SFU64540.1 two-component system, chemotaxis family, CheB/CheR fusion protein [Pustulibacterium marinum]
MQTRSKEHVVVAIGASAGGLESLNSFFSHISDECPFTFIVIQHLSPDYKSLMDELLAKNTNIPIREIVNEAKIEKNRIYLIPPKNNLIVENGYFKLLDKPTGHGLNLPIDLLFESAAKEFKTQFTGIVLSGTGSDGSKGIQVIKKYGGLVIAQQPSQAKFDGMPQSAINTGYVDYILPTEEMSTEIENYFDTEDCDGSDIYSAVESNVFSEIIALLRDSTDLDFQLYKKPTLIRRINKRISILKLKTIEAYYEYIINNDYELHILYEEILIGVTKFFRDKEAWTILEDTLVPQIVASKSNSDVLKIWDVGCSTGEETYSLAMLFIAEIEKQNKDIDLKIFATDISKMHIEIASRGEYGDQIENDIDKERLSRFFYKIKNGYRIKEFIRSTVIFSNHNIIKDPPFKNIDLAVCRNLLIYLQSSIQQNVLHVLHYSLIEQGILFLGSSENLGSLLNNFEEVDRKWKFYRNIKTSKRLKTEMLRSTSDRNITNFQQPNKRKDIDIEKIENRDASTIISDAILDQFGAASVYINGHYDIIEAKGELKKYVSLPEKGFTTNLLKMLPEELKIPLTTSVNNARRNDSKYVYQNILYSIDGKQYLVSLFVKPLYDDDRQEYLVTFVDVDPSEGSIIEIATVSESAAKRINDLEEELEDVKVRLKRSIEETETSNEELQATNEELLASNEELQSTNEELQSVNEELHTVNTENLQKMEDLALLNADINNLLNSTNIGTIFLDNELNIRKYTPSVKEHFNLLPQDIGRPVANFIANFNKEEDFIVKNAQRVLDTGKTFERNVISKSGKHFIKRISPFLSIKNTIEGVVVSFIDVEKMYQSQLRLRRSEEKFKSFYNDDPVMHVSINLDSGSIVEANRLFVQKMGYKSREEVIGLPILDFYPDDKKLVGIKLMDELKNNGILRNQEVQYITKDGVLIDAILNTIVVKDESSNLPITRSTLLDVTELKKVQSELEIEKENLITANKELEQFVSICSHDLQEPLGTIRFGSELVIKKFSDNLEPKGKEYLEYIFDAAGRLSNQIRALLEYSRIGKNREKVSVNTKEMVEVVLYDLSRRVKENNAKVHVGNLPKINAYKTELRLLFQNLIGNALKYRKKDVDPVIKISSYEDGEYQIFSIADNGIGIPEESIDSIFTIFSRVPTEDKYEGTGVGLAHCEKIVKMHEGRIWVDSQLGYGSTFYVKLKTN